MTGPLLVDSSVYGRIFHLAGESAYELGYGAGTVVELEGRQVLLTADHLTTGEAEEFFVLQNTQVIGERSINVPLTRISQRVEGLDVAVFEFPRQLVDFSSLEIIVHAGGVTYTQDVFILGFPYGLYLQRNQEEPRSRIPLVKRGILSGGRWFGGAQTMLVDCIANPGFSGGPAVFRSFIDQRWHFLGVVQGQFVQKAAEGDVEGAAKVPAGITAITELNSALRALKVADLPNLPLE